MIQLTYKHPKLEAMVTRYYRNDHVSIVKRDAKIFASPLYKYKNVAWSYVQDRDGTYNVFNFRKQETR